MGRVAWGALAAALVLLAAWTLRGRGVGAALDRTPPTRSALGDEGDAARQRGTEALVDVALGPNDRAEAAQLEGAPPRAHASSVAGLVLLAGRVVGRDGPVARARVILEVERRAGSFRRTPLWVDSDDSGAFLLRRPEPGDAAADQLVARLQAEAPGPALRLVVRAHGYADESCAVTLGARDVLVRMTAVGRLTARLTHDWANTRPRFELTLSTSAGSRAQKTQERSTFSDVPVGLASLEVRLLGDPTPLVTLTDLCVEAGAECKDPRLDPLDVSRGLAAYAVSIVDHTGAAVDRPDIRAVGADGVVGERTLTCLWVAGDGPSPKRVEAVLSHPTSPPEVMVYARGFEPAGPLQLGNGLVVTMLRRRCLTLRVSPPLEPPASIEVGIGEHLQQLHGVGAPNEVVAEELPLGRARARRVERRGLGQYDTELARAGPWVEFDVPEARAAILELTLPW